MGARPHIQDAVEGVSAFLNTVKPRLLHRSYRSTLETFLAGRFGPPANALVWVDSPYWNRQDATETDMFGRPTEKESFTDYVPAGWSSQESINLLRLLVRCREAGARVMATNHWHTDWIARYESAGFRAVPFEVRRSIAENSDNRGQVTEVLFLG